MTASAHTIHGVTAGDLGLQLATALLVATALSGVLCAVSRHAALGVAALGLVLCLPALAATVLLGPVTGTAALAVAMTPLLVWAWLRLPPAQWRTARALNGSVARVVGVLVAPALAPLLCAALLLGVAALGLRWRLESHPAPLMLPDPVTAAG